MALSTVALLGTGVATASLLLKHSLQSREVARVAIPGSDLPIVTTEDFKHLLSYQVFERGRPVTELRLLGPRLEAPRASVSYGAVTISRVSSTTRIRVVLLNKPGEVVQYFVVPGRELVDGPNRFGKWFTDPKFPGIHPKFLEEFAERWTVFEGP